jgi:ubiquitin carboxyl-terminal hydrolase 10
MATPHPHYPQAGPSSIPYHPPPPPPYAFGGNSPYQHSHQPPPPILSNVGRATYPHQVPGPSPSTFHPNFPLPQPYPPRPGPYHTMERPLHQRPPQSHYQQQHLLGGAPLSHPPNGQLRQGPFIHGTAQQHPPPAFSPSFPQLSRSFPQSPNSPSALPKQLLMPPPSSPLQSQVLPVTPSAQAHPDASSPEPSQELRQHADPESSSLPISPGLQLSSEVQSHPSPTRDTSHLESSPSSLINSESMLTSVWEVFEPCPAFPDRTSVTKGLALQSRRPLVMEAVPVTVSSAARPTQGFYDSLVVPEEAETVALCSPMTNKPLLSPPLEVSAVTDSPDEPDSPPQQSLASSTTTSTTPATSTAPHTPTPGSPHSSMTSISLPTKSPAGVMLEVFPSASVSPIAADSSAHDNESPELPQEPQARPSSNPMPTPPVKKTWASLLHPTSELSNSAGSTSLNSLPTSPVQGFSIPAHTAATPAAPLAPRSGADIVTLLTAPNALVGRVPSIRTRGIVNLGNMCFANTVLQVLVYCPPFNRLFTELDKHMHGLFATGKDPKGGMGTPLVKAT